MGRGFGGTGRGSGSGSAAKEIDETQARWRGARKRGNPKKKHRGRKLKKMKAQQSQAEEELQVEADGEKNTVLFVEADGEKSDVLCGKCGEVVDPWTCQPGSNARTCKVWRCKACNSNLVRLNRVWGKWPTDEFKELTDEEQQDFYKKVKGVAGPKICTSLSRRC